MKSLILILATTIVSIRATAQLTLTGFSYTQNFNGINVGLPPGWSVYTKATATSLGIDVSASNFNSNHVRWNNTTGGFRNSASANNFAFFGLADTASQSAATDRALAVRQVDYTNANFPGSDSGAAFVLKIDNTLNFSNFKLSFKLQSLDSASARATIWKVDYGLGNSPILFTQVAAGINTTGGNTYSNNVISADFGSSLDTNSGPVWIRIIAQNRTTGTGSRPTTGIDDFHLTWFSPFPNIISLLPANNSVGVPTNSNLSMVFNKPVQKGSGDIFITNETDNTTTTIPVLSNDVSVVDSLVTISNVGLLFSKIYHVTFDSTAFDSSGFKSNGIYDTTAWKFSTGPNSIIGVNKNNNIPVTVLGNATANNIQVLFSIETVATIAASIFDLAGREVYRQQVIALKGENKLSLTPASLSGGMYIIRVSAGASYGAVKTIIK